VILLPQDIGAYEISSFIQVYEKESATLDRLTTSISQVNCESEQDQKAFLTFLKDNRSTRDVFLASLIEKCPNKVNNISPKDAFSVHEVKSKFLNLLSAGSNGDSAHHIFANKKN
jgi:hypothetical protein